MQKIIQPEADGFLVKKRRRRRWAKVVSVLGCVVVFCTTYALILPAITAEKTVCGFEEHTHTDECYTPLTEEAQTVLRCTYETLGIHSHTEACYDGDGNLTCGQADYVIHTHDENCYGADGALVCTLPERTAHVHTDACYTPAEEGHVHTDACYELQPGELICGLEENEEHQHGPDCYEQIPTLVCSLEEQPVVSVLVLTCGEVEAPVHQHTESCFETVEPVRELICEIPEHVHTEACYEELTPGDPTADLETAADWEASMSGVVLTGDYRADLLAIAETQLGYHESTRNFIIDEAGFVKGYTRYGEWYGIPYGDWCAMFVSFCLRYAEVPNFPYDCGCTTWINALSAEEYGLYEKAGEYEPQPGDIIFFDLDGDQSSDHVGIVAELIGETETEKAKLRTIEGNAADMVCSVTYEADSAVILGFGRLPEKETGFACEKTAHAHSQYCYGYDGRLLCPIEEHAHSEACLTGLESEESDTKDNSVSSDSLGETTIVLSDEFHYENDSFSIVLHVEGSALLQDDTPETKSEAAINLLSDAEGSPTVEALSEIGDEPVSDEATAMAAPVLVVTELAEQQPEYRQVAAALEEGGTDELLDLSVLSLAFYYQDAPLDVSLCSVTALITPRAQMMETAQAACVELEAEAAPEAETGVVFALLGATEDGTTELDSVIVDATSQESPVLMASVDSNGILAVAAAQTANPKFTVQYYAWLDVVADSGSETNNLPIIDTHSDSGAVLPQNGITPKTKTLYLEETASGSGVYGIKTVSALTRVYGSHDYQYITAPNLTYFNRLYENGHYTLKEIWILKDGKDAESVSQADWDVYDPAVTHFTNRSQSVNSSTVLITDGTVIRLVFDTTESIYTNAVNFYDYDITNDGVHTAAQGINSASNYTGSGTKLAFGNNNTDTGLAGETWNGNTLNKANSNGYSGCTFGLATGLSNGKIQYASGLDVPKLFDDGNAIGKTSYDSGQYTLSFERIGDTYTLSSVGGTSSATSLQTFTGRWNWNNTRKIWSNHFWPMDNVTNTDPHTGIPGNTGTYIGASGTEKSYPESDNGIAHNNMFGMQYTVQFTLTEDYAGPLEYYFFGDDDMWVFLDGTLVCDIGGVHSSVGEYVNLWDYVSQGSAGTHTLSFYYTERGLSGSTCYMQFTLPSVSSITPEQNTGLLTVQKLVEGAVDSDEEFHFAIMFTDENGNPLPDDYSYTRYTADGTVVKQDVIIYDGGSFELKAGEYVIINYLPYGTRYTITETDVPYYVVTYQVDGITPTNGNTAAGQIPTGGNGSVVFTNTAMPVLPETGGAGMQPYITGGLLLITAAGLLLSYIHFKRRKEENSSS
ncbi:MAG: fibro-slime domain-containing protein [Candidatus Limivicinus sp.]